MNTPPYGQNYGYGGGNSPAQAAQPDDSRRPNGPRSPGRHSGITETTRSARQVYPQDGYQGSGGYPADRYPSTGSYQASEYSTGGYQTGGSADASQPGDIHRSNGHQGNGQRAPYDPRDDYRRLTHLS